MCACAADLLFDHRITDMATPTRVQRLCGGELSCYYPTVWRCRTSLPSPAQARGGCWGVPQDSERGPAAAHHQLRALQPDCGGAGCPGDPPHQTGEPPSRAASSPVPPLLGALPHRLHWSSCCWTWLTIGGCWWLRRESWSPPASPPPVG